MIYNDLVVCDDCGEVMYRDEWITPTNPPQYLYYCPTCGQAETYEKLYKNECHRCTRTIGTRPQVWAVGCKIF